ncbi:MAG: hypothetical protein AAGJ40_14225 [Planctomycetota bacterium]
MGWHLTLCTTRDRRRGHQTPFLVAGSVRLAEEGILAGIRSSSTQSPLHTNLAGGSFPDPT